MAKIRLVLRPLLWRPLLGLLEQTMEGMRGDNRHPAGGPEAGDEDLQKAWREGLREALKSDLEVFARFLNAPQSGKTTLLLSEDEALGLVRVASALRLRLQETFLADIPDPSLERGQVSFHHLNPEAQRAYAGYVFLARLQEYLVGELDPESL